MFIFSILWGEENGNFSEISGVFKSEEFLKNMWNCLVLVKILIQTVSTKLGLVTRNFFNLNYIKSQLTVGTSIIVVLQKNKAVHGFSCLGNYKFFGWIAHAFSVNSNFSELELHVQAQVHPWYTYAVEYHNFAIFARFFCKKHQHNHSIFLYYF